MFRCSKGCRYLTWTASVCRCSKLCRRREASWRQCASCGQSWLQLCLVEASSTSLAPLERDTWHVNWCLNFLFMWKHRFVLMMHRHWVEWWNVWFILTVFEEILQRRADLCVRCGARCPLQRIILEPRRDSTYNAINKRCACMCVSVCGPRFIALMGWL